MYSAMKAMNSGKENDTVTVYNSGKVNKYIANTKQK